MLQTSTYPNHTKELLCWHYCLGHIDLHTVQFIMCKSTLATSHAMQRLHKCGANIPSHDMPKCSMCKFGKQMNRLVPRKQTRIISEQSGILSDRKLQPGKRDFINHLECSTRGRKFKIHGIKNKQKGAKVTNLSKLFKGGCIFIDTAIGLSTYNFKASSQL